MHRKHLLLLAIPVLLFSCKKDQGTYIPQIPEPTIPPVLLKDIVIPNLPSPYYHFEYDSTGKSILASFASGFTNYSIEYNGNRINAMQNNIIVNKDRLQYLYDNAGRVNVIKYADSTGVVFKRILLNYDGPKLIALEREINAGPGFVIEKTMTFQYYADGNLREITQHWPSVNGQPAITYTDRYENYDTSLNVDAFSLLHNKFFEHLALLPGITIQKNNPTKMIRTGDGINYEIDYTYTYTYNNKNAPLRKNGTGKWLNGPDAGKIFASNTVYSYY
ncbi:MAG: hypothetical protein V4685_14550 [Bacteroidota bacterium]